MRLDGGAFSFSVCSDLGLSRASRECMERKMRSFLHKDSKKPEIVDQIDDPLLVVSSSIVNLGKELSAHLHGSAQRDRARATMDFLKTVGNGNEVVFSNAEIIFGDGLPIDPAAALASTARCRKIALCWRGGWNPETRELDYFGTKFKIDPKVTIIKEQP